MENQDMNQYYSNIKSPMKKLKLRYVFIPLALDYLIEIIVMLVFCFSLFFSIFNTYVNENVELSQYIQALEDSDAEITMASVTEVFTEDIQDELAEELVDAITENILMITIWSAMASIPIFLWMMKRDKKRFIPMVQRTKICHELWKYIFVVVGSISLCVVLNNILTLSQLAEISQYYQEVSEELYSGSYVVQLIGIGIMTPLAEELLFRGIIYNRFKAFMKPKHACLWSAALFAAYHGNIVQIIYAGIAGIVFVWLYEKYGTFAVAVLAHICMNLTSIILTQYDLFVWIFQDALRMTMITAGSAAVMATMYLGVVNYVDNGALNHAGE